MMSVLFVFGCSTESVTNQQLYETKAEAINRFIEEQSTDGPVLVLEIGRNETILLFKRMGNVYFLGEVANSENKFSATRISAGVDIGNTTGAMWGFKTFKGNEYTLKITKNNEDKESIYNNEFNLYISISSGSRSYEDKDINNVINSDQIFFKQTFEGGNIL